MGEALKKQALLAKWRIFDKSETKEALLNFTDEFGDVYSDYIDPGFDKLCQGPCAQSPHLTQHPELLLDRLNKLNGTCTNQFIVNCNEKSLKELLSVLKCLVVICRNHDNLMSVASCDFVSQCIASAQAVILLLCGQETHQLGSAYLANIVLYVKLVLHFIECLYDPFCVWRKRLKGWIVDAEPMLPKPPPVHKEIIPFFHGCFLKSSLSEELQLCLLNMFGAVMSGSLTNASQAVTPATMDVLFGVLSGKAVCCASPPSELRAVIQRVILQSVIAMLHTAQKSSPDQRQVEVPEIVGSYMQVLSEVASGGDNCQILIAMTETVNKMMASSEEQSLQSHLARDIVFEGLVSVIKNSSGSHVQSLSLAVVRTIQTLLSGSIYFKNVFERCIGHKEFLEVLFACGQPTKDMLQSLLDLIVEASWMNATFAVIRNVPAAVNLMKWVGVIESWDLQMWLSEEMNRLCTCSYGNRIACCQGGMIEVLLSLLSQHSKLQLRTISQIICLLEQLGSFSITVTELKQLIALMKPDDDGTQFLFTTQLMRAMSTMARRDGVKGPLHFFDIQQMADIINLPGIHKWRGAAFSFFSLVCLDKDFSLNTDEEMGTFCSYRRLLYSFTNSSGSGFEAFIIPSSHLTVATFNKKEYSTVTVTDDVLSDGLWHSVCVVHMAGRMFSSSPGHVYVYIDGKLRSSVALKFPSIAEPFTSCRVGSPGTRTHVDIINDAQSHALPEPKRISPLKTLFHFPIRGSEAASSKPCVHTQEFGAQEETWGPTICLHGQLESVCVFHDVLQPEQVKVLNNIGTNSLFHFSEDPVIIDLPGKLIARYSAKTCIDHVCTDLSPYRNHGIFSGKLCTSWDIKDSINCLGGIQVLFPILENLDQSLQPDVDEAESPTTPTAEELLDLDDWALITNKVSPSLEMKLEHNQLAAFITMLRYMLKDKPVNMDVFVRNHCAATLGVLMQKVPKDMMDVNVLMSVQHLVEACDDNSTAKSTLLQHVYHYILFDFSLWSKTQFAVRIGHIQYLSTIIKDDRKYFRKRYGVQFFLDVIRAYYITTEASCLTDERDSKTIRVSLLNLIKYYISSNIHADELSQMMAFILAVKEPTLVLEALDILISLLESRNRKQDQLVLLMYEPNQAEMLYKLLTYPHQSLVFYEKLVKTLYLLLKSDRVYEKSKAHLRLVDIGHWGLVNMMISYSVSAPMIRYFMEQVSFTDTPQTYSAMLALLDLVYNCGLDIKSVASKQLLAVLVSKTGAAKGFARQLGWQENITRLLTLERKRTLTSSSDGLVSYINNCSSNTPAGKDSSHSSSLSSLGLPASLVPAVADAATTEGTLHQTGSTTDSVAAAEDKSVFDYTTNRITVSPTKDTNPKVYGRHPHFTSGASSESFDAANKEDELLLRTGPNVVTPMYTKRTFYELGASEEEDSGLLQDSRSSTASTEDLAHPTSTNDTQAASRVSPSFLEFVEDSALSSSQMSFETDDSQSDALGDSQSDTLGDSQSDALGDSQSDTLGNSQRSVENRQQSTDESFEVPNLRRGSAVLKGQSFKKVLDDIGVELNDSLEQKEELCQHILILLLTIMWKGIEGSSQEVWKERCQVFTWIDELGESHTLIRPAEEIKRRLLEMLLHNCTTDIGRSSGQAVAAETENALKLIQLLQGFVTDPNASPCRFSNRLLEDVMSMLDALGVWDTELLVSWAEMVHRGFSVLLAFCKQPDLDLVSSATVKLHTLIQTKFITSSAQASYILASLNSLVIQAIEANSDSYAYLVPVLKAVLDKGQELLNISSQLPHLPETSAIPTFCDEFRAYAFDEEWQTFINNYIAPQMSHFIESSFEEGVKSVSVFWASCHKDMMMSHHKHNREIGESRIKFKNQIEATYRKKVEQENRRFINNLTQQRNQLLFALRQWRATKRFFVGERGTWKNKEQVVHWKLSNQENFARMKLKLTQNYNFDGHVTASRLRDNLGVSGSGNSLKLEELEKMKEALVSKEDIADDTLGDEEWSAISASNVNLEEYSGKEKLVMSADCELITVVDEVRGKLEITTTHVYFFDCSPNKEEAGDDFKWALSRLREIHFRRYNLRRSALEVFLIDQTNYFINFPQKGMRNKIYSCILSLRPVNLIYKGHRSPGDLLRVSGLTQKWVNREISNFEYLMQLNTIAGRSYNDLSQYPVFPWILVDYTSDHLDLDDPAVFRNLSKPIGVVNPRNEEEVREKYDTFVDPSGMIEKFHYGTHYSNSASVMHYLVRVEPFTTLHVELQSGKFDVADRQFYTIPGSFASLMDNPNDVKELIPEFFYFPEFLINFNGFDLGKLQGTKESVMDVKLPPWARTPEEFIYKHRQALESEYVSMNLASWIDLIFGFKQKGPAAAEALNVFYYVTYEGAVDLDAIQDPKERASLEGMIRNFGQTPSQLLKEPHPRRLTFSDAVARNAKAGKPMSVFNFIHSLKPFFVEISSDRDPLVFVTVPKSQLRSILQQGMPDSMVTLTEEGIIGVHGWLPFDKAIPNFYTFDKDARMASPKTRKRLEGPFFPGLKVKSKLFTVSHDAKLLFSGGFWDNSLHVYGLTRLRMISRIVRHTDVVTCLALDSCGRHLVSGSRDTTCMVWEIIHQAGVSVSLNPNPLQTLYGHDSEVTAVHISTELDMVASSSKDGTVILHTVLKGHYTRTLTVPSDKGTWVQDIPSMVVSEMGQIVVYCVEVEREAEQGRKRQQERHCLHVYSVNGKHLFSEILQHALTDLCVVGDHLILGNSMGQLIIKETFGLTSVTTMELLVPIQCLAMSNINSHILVGLADGKLIIVGHKGK